REDRSKARGRRRQTRTAGVSADVVGSHERRLFGGFGRERRVQRPPWLGEPGGEIFGEEAVLFAGPDREPRGGFIGQREIVRGPAGRPALGQHLNLAEEALRFG